MCSKYIKAKSISLQNLFSLQRVIGRERGGGRGKESVRGLARQMNEWHYFEVLLFFALKMRNDAAFYKIIALKCCRLEDITEYLTLCGIRYCFEHEFLLASIHGLIPRRKNDFFSFVHAKYCPWILNHGQYRVKWPTEKRRPTISKVELVYIVNRFKSWKKKQWNNLHENTQF